MNAYAAYVVKGFAIKGLAHSEAGLSDAEMNEAAPLLVYAFLLHR